MTKHKKNVSIPRKDTDHLEAELSASIDLEDFLTTNAAQFTSCEIGNRLNELISERNISKAELARRAKMSDVYLFQILSGRRQPSRDRVICLCLGLECTLAQTRRILKDCRYMDLYIHDRRDAIIMYAFEQGWTLNHLNDALYEAKQKTLA